MQLPFGGVDVLLTVLVVVLALVAVVTSRLQMRRLVDETAGGREVTRQRLLALSQLAADPADTSGSPMGAGEVLRASAIMVGDDAAGASRRSLTSRALTRQAADDAVGILVELLDNALTHADPKAEITITAADDQDGGVVLQVQDSRSDMTGDEIAAANRVLTDPRSASTAFDGFGLLVAGCLAARHGIEVELAAKQAGTVATVRVPPTAIDGGVEVATSAATPPPPLPGTVSPAPGPSVPAPVPVGASAVRTPTPAPASAGLPIRGSSAPTTVPVAGETTPTARPAPSRPAQDWPGSLPARSTGRPASPAAVPAVETTSPGRIAPARQAPPRQAPARPAPPPPAPQRQAPSRPAPVAASAQSPDASRPVVPAPAPLTQRRPGTSWPSSDADPRQPVPHPEQPPAMPRGSQNSLFGDGVEQTRASMGNMLGGDQSRAAPPRPVRRETTGSAPVIKSPSSPSSSDASIFDALESRWFEEHAPRARRKRVHDSPWSSPADQGWTAAERLFEETKAQLTGAGLPRREPMSHLVPGAVAPGTGRRRRVSDSDPVMHGSRDALTSYQAGIERARYGEGLGGSHS